jgi:hypothetical protein
MEQFSGPIEMSDTKYWIFLEPSVAQPVEWLARLAVELYTVMAVQKKAKLSM